jgi:hypothetical protein
MIYGKGVVKKYSREYVRTLKNGKKKKYKTQQIQITVPKQEDIYQDGEEVLIVPSSSNEELEESFEIISTLELFNNILNTNLEKAEKIIDEKNSTIKNYEEKIRELEDKAPSVVEVPDTKLLDSYNNLKKDYDDVIKEFESIKDLKKDYDAVVEELESIEHSALHNSYMMQKYKNFILNSE